MTRALPGDSAGFDLYDGRDMLRHIPVIPSPSMGGEGGGEMADACARIRISPPSPPSPSRGKGPRVLPPWAAATPPSPFAKGREGDFAALALGTTAINPPTPPLLKGGEGRHPMQYRAD
jgi:hypothetical protein